MEKAPLVTVVIPTYNRLDLLPNAVDSVLKQTFQDFEIIVVDDGMEKRAREVVECYKDKRIRYIKHATSKGCSGAKNTGIKNAHGRYIAFLDDDDTWMPEKLKIQATILSDTPEDVGFSFTAALEVFDNREATTDVPEGIGDYFDFGLRRFSGMIASSLMFKGEVFEKVGYLDEAFPTHTDIELLLRVTQKYRGVGINKPLVRRAMQSGHMQMGSNIKNRIRGREMLLERYHEEFARRPLFLAKHLTQLGMFYRTIGEYGKAREVFKKALSLNFRFLRLAHYLSMFFGARMYRFVRLIKDL